MRLTTSKRMESRFGITAPQRLVVRIVGRFPGVSAGRLAEILHLHPSTLTAMLIRLEARGLVLRRADSRDRRRVRVWLSRNGRRLTRPAVGWVETAVKQALADFPDKKITTAQEVLANIARMLEDLDVPAE